MVALIVDKNDILDKRLRDKTQDLIPILLVITLTALPNLVERTTCMFIPEYSLASVAMVSQLKLMDVDTITLTSGGAN